MALLLQAHCAALSSCYIEVQDRAEIDPRVWSDFAYHMKGQVVVTVNSTASVQTIMSIWKVFLSFLQIISRDRVRRYFTYMLLLV